MNTGISNGLDTPEREHVAVLVAEDITSRFLNIVSLLNKSIPLIAIQMQAFEVGSYLTLVFTTVVDRFSRPDDEEDEGQSVVTRADWESKGLKAGLAVVDELAGFAREKDPDFVLKYNQAFIQVNKHGKIFLTFRPQKVQTKINIRMGKTTQSEDLERKMKESGLAVEYKDGKRYRIAVDNDKFKEHASEIKDMVSLGLNEPE